MEKKKTVGAVYLAAGSSTRFGSNKLLYPIDGKFMFEHGLDLLASCIREGVLDAAVAVTQYSAVADAAAARGLSVAENPNCFLGISSSIALGLHAMGDKDACLFLVADQPYLKKDSVIGLILEWRKHQKGIGCLAKNSHWGNPVIFSSNYYPELLALTGDRGGKQIAKKHAPDVWTWEAESERELEDLDILKP